MAAQPLAAGREVYNTYGEHGNAELVNKYGFALPHNPFDEVRRPPAVCLSESTSACSGRALHRWAHLTARVHDFADIGMV